MENIVLLGKDKDFLEEYLQWTEDSASVRFTNLDWFHGLCLAEIQSSGLVFEDPHSLRTIGSGTLHLQTVNFDDLREEREKR